MLRTVPAELVGALVDDDESPVPEGSAVVVILSLGCALFRG